MVNAVVCYVCVAYTALVSHIYLDIVFGHQTLVSKFVLVQRLIAGWPQSDCIDWINSCHDFGVFNCDNCNARHLSCWIRCDLEQSGDGWQNSFTKVSSQINAPPPPKKNKPF